MENNFAFIDGQNLYFELKKEKLELNYEKFRKYLKDKYKISVAYLFLGYLEYKEDLYVFLKNCGYNLIFKENVFVGNRKIKGNIDAELTLQIKIDFDVFDKCIIVSGDGDFYCWIKYLIGNNKLKTIISPRRESCSKSIKKIVSGNVVFLNDKSNAFIKKFMK